MTSVYVTFEAIRSLGQTFAERIGPPDECTSALGHVTVAFSWLEESLEQHIASLTQLSASVASVLTAEVSFKTKVSILSSLVRLQPPLRIFNVGAENQADVWSDILKMLSRCEELRNRLSHSRWSLANGQKIRRTKITAKARRGIRVSSEELTADYLLDVYDYILNVRWALDEFFL